MTKIIDTVDIPPFDSSDADIENDTEFRADKAEINDLLQGQKLDVNLPISDYPKVAAVIRTISESQLKDGIPDVYTVIDLRGVPVSGGYKAFDGEEFAPEIQYLVINPSQLDWKNNLGFKGIRRGEAFNMGRYVYHTEEELQSLSELERKSLAIKRDRFPLASDWTSRNHFSLSCDDQGVLQVADLNSSNGTAVAIGEEGPRLLMEEEHQRIINEICGPIGETAVQFEVSPIIETAQSELYLPKLTAEVAKKKTMEILGPEQPQLNKDLLDNFPYLSPSYEIEVENHIFYFSSAFELSGRLHTIAFVDKNNDGQYVPRLFYKSNSEGGWRSCPWVEDTGYSKGSDEYDGGYVQVTKPVEDLAKKLEILSIDRKNLRHLSGEDQTKFLNLYDIDRDEVDAINTFDEEVTTTRLDRRWCYGLYDAFEPGIGFKIDPRDARAQLENMSLPPGFEPDFKQEPERIYATEHTIAGLTEVRVFSSSLSGRPVEWFMARSQTGNVWVESIRFTDVEMTTYGTPSEIILAGALSAKPFDYGSQVDYMEQGVDFDRIDNSHGRLYVNLQKTWDRMPTIKRYKQALGLN